jgi:hypothetical protein
VNQVRVVSATRKHGQEQHAMAKIPAQPNRVKPDFVDDDLEDLSTPDVVITVPNLFAAFACEWMGRTYRFWPDEEPVEEDEDRP